MCVCLCVPSYAYFTRWKNNACWAVCERSSVPQCSRKRVQQPPLKSWRGPASLPLFLPYCSTHVLPIPFPTPLYFVSTLNLARRSGGKHCMPSRVQYLVGKNNSQSQKLEGTKYTWSPISSKLEGTRPTGPVMWLRLWQQLKKRQRSRFLHFKN